MWQHPACALLGLTVLSRPEGFSTSAESSAPGRNRAVGFLFSPLQGEPGESGEPGLPGEVGLPVSTLRDVVERSFLSVVSPGSWWQGFWGGMGVDGAAGTEPAGFSVWASGRGIAMVWGIYRTAFSH